jgi:SAM-dependent methyltransferase
MNRQPKDVYERNAVSWDEKLSTATSVRLDHINSFIIDYLGPVKNAVELGVGSGGLLSKVNAEQRIGLDLSLGMCARAKARGIESLAADQAHAPISSSSVSAVVSGYGSGRYTPLAKFTSEIARILKDGGRFGLHLFPGKRFSPRLTITAPFFEIFEQNDDGWFDLPPWYETTHVFHEAGLAVEGHLMMRNLKLPPYFFRIRYWMAMPLATHVALVGRRMKRSFVERRNAITAKLNSDDSTEVVVAGVSMEPTLRLKDRITITRCCDYRQNDIVLLQLNDGLVTHRIRDIVNFGDATWIAHRGDRPGSATRLAEKWRVMGKVVL